MAQQKGRKAVFNTGDENLDVAPGQYYDEQNNPFGSDGRSFRIGEKREQYHDSTVGPGEYSPDRADNMTRNRSPNINLGSTKRRNDFAGGDRNIDVGPGQYDDGNPTFGSSVPGFTIGEKRD